MVAIGHITKSGKTRYLPGARGDLDLTAVADHNKAERKQKLHQSRRDKLFDPEKIAFMRNRLSEALSGSQEERKRDSFTGRNIIHYDPAKTIKQLFALKRRLKNYDIKLTKADKTVIEREKLDFKPERQQKNHSRTYKVEVAKTREENPVPQFLRFVDEAKDTLREIYNFKIPGMTRDNGFGGEIPITFNTPFDTDRDGYKDEFFEENPQLLSEDGDFERAAKRFDWIRDDDRAEALTMVYEPIKALAQEVWDKLNKIAGNEKVPSLENLSKTRSNPRRKASTKYREVTEPQNKRTHHLGDEPKDPFESLNYKKIAAQIKDRMKKALNGEKTLAWARRSIGELQRKLKTVNHDAMSYTKAKTLAAFDFAREFLRRGEHAKVPEAIVIHAPDKDFTIKREQLPGIDKLGRKILQAYGDIDSLAA